MESKVIGKQKFKINIFKNGNSFVFQNLSRDFEQSLCSVQTSGESKVKLSKIYFLFTFRTYTM